ncbi:hypothetical protein RUM43_006533 [Polyplax serrata]|uniref:Uncharacterized protein n=1 Tax=Polyplax serrata TaxID=468196 RepID=A0AAN8PYT7_POLSC
MEILYLGGGVKEENFSHKVKQENKNEKGNIHKRLKVYAQEEAKRNLEKRQIRIRHILAKDQTQKKLSSNVCFKKLMNRNAGTRAFYKSILNGGNGQNQDRQSLKWPKTSQEKWHDEDSQKCGWFRVVEERRETKSKDQTKKSTDKSILPSS